MKHNLIRLDECVNDVNPMQQYSLSTSIFFFLQLWEILVHAVLGSDYMIFFVLWGHNLGYELSFPLNTNTVSTRVSACD